MSATPVESVIRIGIVTPQPLVAIGIQGLVEGRHGSRTITTDPLAGPPDVVFYDVIGLHESDGSDLDALVAHAASRVVAVTRSLCPDLGAAALGRGAHAAISSGASGADFLELIDAAVAGNLSECVVSQEARRETRPGFEAGLTRREAEILAMIVRGRTNREIAQDCVLSINSVKSYIRSAYRKMPVTTRSQAVAWGVQHGFAPGADATPPAQPASTVNGRVTTGLSNSPMRSETWTSHAPGAGRTTSAV
jgi:DNA-binding NarL/FixJ family response regulator